jgi:hypothetical protein
MSQLSEHSQSRVGQVTEEKGRSVLVISFDVRIYDGNHLSSMSAETLLHLNWSGKCSRIPSEVSFAIRVFDILCSVRDKRREGGEERCVQAKGHRKDNPVPQTWTPQRRHLSHHDSSSGTDDIRERTSAGAAVCQ